MKSLISAVRKIVRQPAVAEAVAAKTPISIAPPIPLNIYEDLPSLGDDTENIMEMIQRAFPDLKLYSQHLTRANRRKLYMSIHFLRTDSKRQWVYDVEVGKGQFTTDSLIRVAATQRSAVH